MRIALLADIHGNLEALNACLADVNRRGADRMAILGDIVGYGADPVAVIDRVRALQEHGTPVLMGNHDSAIGNQRESMNAAARAAIDWTRERLSTDEHRWLAALPLTCSEDNRLYVHASPREPAKWHYVTGTDEAALGLSATQARVVLCGHVHVPQIFGLSLTGKVTAFRPVAEAPVPLLPQRRWLAVMGAVGQPRDGIPAAAYSVLDTDDGSLTLRRVPYDIDSAARKILAARLPEVLAVRLFAGH